MGCYRVSFNNRTYKINVFPEEDDENDDEVSIVRLKNHIVGKMENVSFSEIRLYYRSKEELYELTNEDYLDDVDEEDDLYEVVIDNAT